MLKKDDDIPYIDKPWGYERIFGHTDSYVGKYLFIEAGHRLSRQYHTMKEETVYVLAGPLIIEIGPDDDGHISQIELVEGDAYHLVPGTIHRFCAPDTTHVELIEVSTPELQDVVRIEDDYSRFPVVNA